MTDIPLIHIDNRNRLTKQDYKIENCDIQGVYDHYIIADIIYLKLFLPKNNKYYGELSFLQFDYEPFWENIKPYSYIDSLDDLFPYQKCEVLDSQIPLIDIFVCKYKEDIVTQQLKLTNVSLSHNGYGLSIDDITKGTVYDITVEEVTEGSHKFND